MFRPMPTSDLLSGHRRGELLAERDTRAASAAAFLRSLKAATSSLGSRSNLPKPCCETISNVMSRVTCSRITRQQGSEPGHRAVSSISGEKSEEDHATNLIYIEIFKIGVDPLSEAAVVKTKASSAGTREPSARRIDVD